MRQQEGYTYILQSEKHGRYYVGSCTNIERRLSEHNRGHTKSTRKQGPWVLCCLEKYETLELARRREREIKRWKSRRMIEVLIRTQEQPRL